MNGETKEEKVIISPDDTTCPECGSPLVHIPNGTLDFDIECKGCGLSA